MLQHILGEVNLWALAAFAFLFVFRYLRTVVSIYSWYTFAPKEIQDNPTFTSKDVTVVIPTVFRDPEELLKTIHGALQCQPAALLIVSSNANTPAINAFLAVHSLTKRVVVLGVDKLNKRVQMLRALEETHTDIVTFADDDVIWPNDMYLDYVLALFEDPKVGAGGTRQRVLRRTGNSWNFLGISYLERRAWNNVSTNAIDGSISTLSGRTATYRTAILKNEAFVDMFSKQNDDDKALTRWTYSQGWTIGIQADDNAVLETTLEESSKFIDQCLRWARGRYRGNFTVMRQETYWYSLKYFWGLYVIYIGQFQAVALFNDSLLFALLHLTFASSIETRNIAFAVFGAWVFFTKIMKLIPHFIRHPSDMKYIPLSIAFSYLHGFFTLYAAFTLTNTAWGAGGATVVAEVKVPEMKVKAHKAVSPAKVQLVGRYRASEHFDSAMGSDADSDADEPIERVDMFCAAIDRVLAANANGKVEAHSEDEQCSSDDEGFYSDDGNMATTR